MGTVVTHRTKHVWTFELSNAGKANAMDSAMLDCLEDALLEVESTPDVRVVVLCGKRHGPFSSGADINEWGPMSPEQFGQSWIDRGNSIFRRLEHLRCPTIAAIEGACFGGGLELALCADLRLASRAARFRFPEVTLGAMPGWEGGPRLARVVGRGRALEMVLGACELDADTAHRWGLVNAVCPRTDLEELVAHKADWIARVSPLAAQQAKAAILNDRDSRAFHLSATTILKATEDAAIGIRAFGSNTMAIF